MAPLEYWIIIQETNWTHYFGYNKPKCYAH